MSRHWIDINGKKVYTSVSEDNGGHTPMVMMMSHYELDVDEKRVVKEKAIALSEKLT
jgi:hypothetical protein